MIKFEHTVFALPFALIGALLARRGLPTVWQTGWIIAAMIGGRSAAMVITVEPGIYIPEEEIGIRIEDDVLVTPTGYRVLSTFPKEIAEIEALVRH